MPDTLALRVPGLALHVPGRDVIIVDEANDRSSFISWFISVVQNSRVIKNCNSSVHQSLCLHTNITIFIYLVVNVDLSVSNVGNEAMVSSRDYVETRMFMRREVP